MHSVNYIDLSEEDIMKQRFPYLKLDDRDHPFFDDDGAGYVKARAMVEAQKKVAHKQGCHIVDDIVEEVKDFKDGAHEKEKFEEWMSIDEDIPVAATIIDLEICQAKKVDDSDRDERVEENSPTNAKMRQSLDILKLGVQHCLTNFKQQYEYEQYK
ncbi:hypothetical protein AVEN_229887-1 [Araneus ventricosus]|uniref:Uncharacterized protein n=1 Tax=Araneus ventricosus TaxID=182803 RepID=A0A4Y2URN4_ARAVE|nr:hypothetical protein AVEN_229887-1 [Araneus ventricosus]